MPEPIQTPVPAADELARSGQDPGDHQKHTLPYAWVASAIMVAVGCVACGLLF